MPREDARALRPVAGPPSHTSATAAGRERADTGPRRPYGPTGQDGPGNGGAPPGPRAGSRPADVRPAPGYRTRPQRKPSATACARSEAPSFLKSRLAWVLTVSSDRNSSRPISALERP